MSNSKRELNIRLSARWILRLLQSLFDSLLAFEWVVSSGCPEYCILFCNSRDQWVESVPSREVGDPVGLKCKFKQEHLLFGGCILRTRA